jgi:hypothetical protein
MFPDNVLHFVQIDSLVWSGDRLPSSGGFVRTGSLRVWWCYELSITLVVAHVEDLDGGTAHASHVRRARDLKSAVMTLDRWRARFEDWAPEVPCEMGGHESNLPIRTSRERSEGAS